MSCKAKPHEHDVTRLAGTYPDVLIPAHRQRYKPFYNLRIGVNKDTEL